MDLIKPLITLLAIVNPLAIVPFFIHYTQGFTDGQRRRTILVSSFSAFIVIAHLRVAGLAVAGLLRHLDRELPGGRRLAAADEFAVDAQCAAGRDEDHDQEEIRATEVKASLGASIAVVPLTIPLLTGPATMSTVVIYAEKTRHFWELLLLVGYGAVIAIATAAAFSLAQPIARVLGKTGINVMTRLDGPDPGGAGGRGDGGRLRQALPDPDALAPCNQAHDGVVSPCRATALSAALRLVLRLIPKSRDAQSSRASASRTSAGERTCTACRPAATAPTTFSTRSSKNRMFAGAHADGIGDVREGRGLRLAHADLRGQRRRGRRWPRCADRPRSRRAGVRRWCC